MSEQVYHIIDPNRIRPAWASRPLPSHPIGGSQDHLDPCLAFQEDQSGKPVENDNLRREETQALCYENR